ncbi:hypothetical protein E1B28_008185 [Marasmius oreades]|uniref:Uncharacterized protein n=1 Tax=Marasmius oreades TaxID=181124 RepID=A0A9P7RXW7_9AGAR|nr:uncharacterized protein E1B28_008185 [Marasmius oreades]KAG7091781.1 hypothetical protein E1B28_008185 [Marasmius oreades]
MEDGDEGIVLSDLLRTGEASRLRRRGAIRDHRHPPPPAPPPHPLTQAETTYRLFCRGGEALDRSGWSNECFSPDLFGCPTKERLEKKVQQEMPGLSCGALVHTSASSTYIAYTEPSPTVVPLDAIYFDADHDGGKLGENSCGCVRVGLGCSICGAPLGTRYTPCKPSSSTAVYSFFPDAVYTCPEPQKWPQPRPESESEFQPQSLRPPRRRSTRIGEDQVNAALSALESLASSSTASSSSLPMSSSPSPVEHDGLEYPNTDDPELAWALATPWFGFSVSSSQEGCDAPDVDDQHEDDEIDDIDEYLERRIRGILFECRGDEEEDEEEDEEYDEEHDSSYDPLWFSGEERGQEWEQEQERPPSLSSLQHRSRSPPPAPSMTRSYAHSRFR